MQSNLRTLLIVLGIVWALPYTLISLAIDVVGLCTGGRGRIRGRTVEFYEGGTKRFVTCLPHGQFTMAFTLGHTILGQTEAALDICRDHEMVRVRQFERWGLLMGPAYLLASLDRGLIGKRAYRDNLFECEAYELGGGE